MEPSGRGLSRGSVRGKAEDAVREKRERLVRMEGGYDGRARFRASGTLLPRITAGAAVYDRDQREVGRVCAGERRQERHPRGSLDAKGLRPDRQLEEIPRNMAQRLGPHGFIEIASRSPRAHRYAASDQIVGVDSQGVHLSIAEQELLTMERGALVGSAEPPRPVNNCPRPRTLPGVDHSWLRRAADRRRWSAGRGGTCRGEEPAAAVAANQGRPGQRPLPGRAGGSRATRKTADTSNLARS